MYFCIIRKRGTHYGYHYRQSKSTTVLIVPCTDAENHDENYFVRVAVESGGCSGLSYNLNFDNQEKKGDQFCEDKGIRVCLDIKSYLYLAGTELDYSDGLNGHGFEFHNPECIPHLCMWRKLFCINICILEKMNAEAGL